MESKMHAVDEGAPAGAPDSPGGTRRGDRGFTLIEVAISMFFLMFIIEGVMMTSLYAQRSAIHSRRLTSANIIAEQSVERYRNVAFANLNTHNGRVICYDAWMNPDVDGDGNSFWVNGVVDAGDCAHAKTAFSETTTVAATAFASVLEVEVDVDYRAFLTWSALFTDIDHPLDTIKIVTRISR